MTAKELKIAAISASLAAFLGIGASKTIAGASPAVVQNATLRIFHAQDTNDAGVTRDALAFEFCAQAIAGETIVEQGCESAPVPAAMQAKVDGLMLAAQGFWEAKRGLK